MYSSSGVHGYPLTVYDMDERLGCSAGGAALLGHELALLVEQSVRGTSSRGATQIESVCLSYA